MRVIDIHRSFEKEGIVKIKNYLSTSDLDVFKKTYLEVVYSQCAKIAEYKKKIDKIYNNSKMSTYDKICKIYQLLEKKDKECLYQIQKLISQNIDLINIMNSKVLKNLFRTLLKINQKQPLFCYGPGILINTPNKDRLLYKWHTEAIYYPKRRNFLNIYFPLFTNKNKKNGTIFLKKKSHLQKDFPFNEHQGFNKSSKDINSSFIQYEIPNNFVKEFDDCVIDANVNEMVIFHRNTVHRSNENLTNKTTFAVTFRIWESSKDLTISGDFAVKSYKDLNNGRHGLFVDR